MTDQDSMPASSRGEKISAAYRAKLDNTFKGKKFTIVRPVHLPLGQAYRSAFGHVARHGWVIRDLTAGTEMVVGARLLRQIHDLYDGVDLPQRRRDQRAA